MTQNNIEKYPPNLLLKPNLPDDINIFTGFTRAAEIIHAGEICAIKMLPILMKKLDVIDRKRG